MSGSMFVSVHRVASSITSRSNRPGCIGTDGADAADASHTGCAFNAGSKCA